MRNLCAAAAALLAAGCLQLEADADTDAESALGLSDPSQVTDLAKAFDRGVVGADPSAFLTDGAVHVYTTSRAGLNVPHFTAANARDPNEALPDRERGAGLTGGIWAPTVRRAGNQYAMWYSGELAGDSTKKCLWRARADQPEGPFSQVGDGAAICPDPNWNIDPYLTHTPAGFVLYAKVGGQLQRRALQDDGVSFASGSSWQLVVGPSQSWEQAVGMSRPLVENPAMVQLSKPNGVKRWLFFYSANGWRTREYAVGYADCGKDANPGPCNKESLQKPWLSTGVANAPRGPGGEAFFTIGNQDYMISHGWENACNDPADTCASSNDPCPNGSAANDCRFENPGGRRLYLFRVGLNDNGNPVARRL